MNDVSIYGILTRKKIKHSLFLLLPLIFASWCLPYKTPAVVSGPFYTVSLFNLGDIMMEPLAMFIGGSSHVFRRKSKWECRK